MFERALDFRPAVSNVCSILPGLGVKGWSSLGVGGVGKDMPKTGQRSAGCGWRVCLCCVWVGYVGLWCRIVACAVSTPPGVPPCGPVYAICATSGSRVPVRVVGVVPVMSRVYSLSCTTHHRTTLRASCTCVRVCAGMRVREAGSAGVSSVRVPELTPPTPHLTHNTPTLRARLTR